jgi:hypothetical protein
MASMAGFRMRFQEAGGMPCSLENCSQLTWPETFLVADKHAGHVELQKMVKPKRVRKGVYESSCSICYPDTKKTPSPQNNKPPASRKVIYFGESSRSLFERAKEYMTDATSFSDKSQIIKHWMETHPDLNNIHPFKFRVVSGFKDCLTRQVSEAISIWHSPDSLLNSKNEYITNCITRITVQEDQLERKLREIEEEKENAKLAHRLMEFRKAKSREGKREGDVDMSKLPPPKKAKLDTPTGPRGG